ncbi:MAG: hypothetical protein EA416_07330 [Trueperaceae bacterium]|nr:MAG: hypothetical protein EA416_07330 [Trueperaceae bacterium]
MTDHTVAEWAEDLRRFAAACRTARPLPDRGAFTAAQEWQCRIVGGALLAWLHEHGPGFLRERATMAALLGVDPDPVIVFTSDVPGLVAAREILGDDHELVICLLEEEFADAPARAADPGYVRHVHVWSRFLPELEREVAAAARAQHPISASSSYWQHAEGTMWAPNAGRGVDHLWRWDGREADLLEEALTHWVA